MTHRANSCSRIPLNNGPFLTQLGQALFSTCRPSSIDDPSALVETTRAPGFSTASVGVASVHHRVRPATISSAANRVRRTWRGVGVLWTRARTCARLGGRAGCPAHVQQAPRRALDLHDAGRTLYTTRVRARRSHA